MNTIFWSRNVYRRVRRLKGKVIILVVAVMILYLICQIIEPSYPEPDQQEAYIELQRRLEILVRQEKGTGCVMPKLDPFSPEVTQFDEKYGPIVCETDDWVECHLSECHVKKSILDRMRDISCSYRDLVYVDDYNRYYEKAVEVEGDGKYELNRSDHVKVSCKGTPVDSLGLFASRWQGFKAGYRPVEPPVEPPGTALNVFIIMIDSMSKNEFIRLMPLTYKALKDDLNAVVMDTYNIVGHATAGAMLPILMGRNDLEVPDWRRMPGNKRLADPKYLVTSLLEEYGYRTAFYEDSPRINLFNYRYNGFERPPAHHYVRPLFQEEIYSKELMNFLFNADQCFGTEMVLKFMINYSAQMFKTSGKKFCLIMSSIHSHDPHFIYITQMDDALAQFIKKFKQDGHLEDTVLFVMGDHGKRFSYVRNTYQGKLEERLPFVSLTLPERLKRDRPMASDNLAANSKVLTTPYDIHTTILDALGLKQHRNRYKVPGADIERGMSLLEPIPRSRSCAEAGIMPHWCACEQWHSISGHDVIYKKAAMELARYVNQMTEQNRKLCAKRNLLAIVRVDRKTARSEILGFKAALPLHEFVGRFDQTHLVTPNFVHYQAKIIMDPGVAIFEATMLYNSKEDYFSISNRDVSRVNKYGNEARCVELTQPLLNPYCYCI